MSASDSASSEAVLARRVALLAKPGQARDRLRTALLEAGASIVVEADPGELECQALAAAAPHAVLIALESGTEDSLDRFDAVFNDPAVALIYDEAELAARREGWEAQRWARHLRAKLHGHADVLPPGGEAEPDQLRPGRPRTPAQLHEGADIEMHLEEAQARSSELPQGGLQAVAEPATSEGLYLDLEPEPWTPRPGTVLELVETEAASGVATTAATAAKPPLLAGASALPLELEPLDGQSPQAPDAPKAASGLAKVTLQRGALLLFAGIGGPDAVRKVLAALPDDLSRAVVVQLRLDGGRYDNLVKQMRRASVLPVQLAVAGAAALPGHVHVLPTGVAMHVEDGAVQFREGETDMDTLVGALPPRESAILMLSGSDAGHIEAVAAFGQQGAYVAGQSPQGCYDAVASRALEARGGSTGTPAELAAAAVAHFGA